MMIFLKNQLGEIDSYHPKVDILTLR